MSRPISFQPTTVAGTVQTEVSYSAALGHVRQWLDAGLDFRSIHDQVELALPRVPTNDTSYRQSSNWRAALDEYNPANPRSTPAVEARRAAVEKRETEAAPGIDQLRGKEAPRSIQQMLAEFESNGGERFFVSLLMPSLKHPAEIEAFVRWASSQRDPALQAHLHRAASTLGEMAPGTHHIWKDAVAAAGQRALQPRAPNPGDWNGQ